MRLRCIYRASILMRSRKLSVEDACRQAIYTPGHSGADWLYCVNPECMLPGENRKLMLDVREFNKFVREQIEDTEDQTEEREDEEE